MPFSLPRRAFVGLLLLAGCKRQLDSPREPDRDAAAVTGAAPSETAQEKTNAEEKRREALAALADAGRPCRAPLEEDCPCPTYDAAWKKAVSASGTLPCSAGGVETGDCGEHRYVATRSPASSSTLYFTKDGRLIGTERGSDYAAYCNNTSTTISFGKVPTCTLQPKRKVCREQPRAFTCICGDPLCVSDAGCVSSSDR
jgi:hypothetical protein